MKKVIAFFLVLIAVSMAFAETTDSLRISTKVKENPADVAFTESAYTVPSDALTRLGSASLKDITSATEADRSKEFWASAKTNSANPLTLSIYGTALTLKPAADTYDSTETVPLTLSLVTDASNSSTATVASVTFNTANTGSTRAENNSSEKMTLVEGASADSSTGVAGNGNRALTWKLKIVANNEDAATVKAGNSESYIWLEVGSGPAGA